MFDIGFSELLVIGIVALIVIGPERLPKVARTAGQWLGRLNRYVAQVKQDIDRDIKLEELRKLQQEMKETAQKYQLMAEEARQEIRAEAAQVEKVVAAMSATDDGLSKKAYDEMMNKQAGEAPPVGAQPAPTPPAHQLTGIEADLDAPIPTDDMARVPHAHPAGKDQETGHAA